MLSNCPQMQPPRCPAGDPCKCPCLNPEAVTYLQPLPPPSCAPKQVYRHPKTAVESATVYKQSYPGCSADMARLAKPDLCRPDQGPIKVPGVIDGNTTTTLSYQYPHGTRPAPCRPFGSNLMGRGPMQDATTQKVDYAAKPYCRRQPFSDPRVPFPDVPMEGWTTTQLSYAAPQDASAAQSMKPAARVSRVQCPVDGLTTQKLSYVPPAVLPREEYPWMQKGRYHRPCVPFAGHTTYTSSFVPPGQCVKLEATVPCVCRCPCQRPETLPAARAMCAPLGATAAAARADGLADPPSEADPLATDLVPYEYRPVKESFVPQTTCPCR